jgi:nucleoid DNA-binding protein
MTYDHLIAALAEATGQSQAAVRELMFILPDILITLEEGDMVRTPLGVFRMMKRGARHVTPPSGSRSRVKIPDEMVVKMRAGLRLRKKP